MTNEKSSRVLGRLKLSNLKLNTILEITNAINSNASKSELFSILKSVLLDDLLIEKFVFFTYDLHWKSSIVVGVDEAKLADINIYKLINNYRDIDVIHDMDKNEISEFDIVIPVFHKSNPIGYLLLADLQGDKLEISPIIRHLKFIQTLANIIVVALENSRLYKEEIKQIAVKKELEMAQSMQSLLFPSKLPNTKHLLVDAYYFPHSEVGGDYYDVIEITENKTAICIADVSGKGMPAALLMANFQANLRALVSTESNIENIIKKCNDKIIESAHFEKFITLFIGIFDKKEKTINYLNAGHQPALLIQNNTITELKTGCTILGMFETLPSISSKTVGIEKNAKLICFTDGLSELEYPDGNQLEIEGIKQLLNPKMSHSEIKTQIENKISAMEIASGINDDVTILVAELLR